MTYLKGKKLIGLPCTAHDLEVALHAQCDHGGLWDRGIYICGNALVIDGDGKEPMQEKENPDA